MVQSSGNEAQWTKVQQLFCLGTPTSLLPSSVLLPFFLLLTSPLSALPPQPLPYPLTFLVEHPPASYPAGCIIKQLQARGWEAGRDDVGSEVHRKEQLQHGYVTSEGMKLLKVWVHDNLAHGHLQGVLSVFKQLRAS